LTKKES